MNKAKQLMIATICGFGPDHELVRDAVSHPEIAEQIRAGVAISKEDLFESLSDGKTLFEHREAWSALPALIGAVRENGGEVSFEDFTAAAPGRMAPVEQAISSMNLDKLFGVELWQGRSDREMVHAWFNSAASSVRRDYDFTALRRRAAEARGEDLREDQLARMGITPDNIREAIKDGKVADLNKKMAEHGDHLRKSDLFIFDSVGDHMLDTGSAWRKTDMLWKELEAHGEALGADDFLLHTKDRKSMLQTAYDSFELKQIFSAAVWKGRAPEMLVLFNTLAESPRRDGIGIEDILNKIAEEEYGQAVPADRIAAKADLLSVLNAKDEAVGAQYRPIIALGLEETWKHMDEVRKALRAAGEKLTLDDLRLKSGYSGDSCLKLAARYGRFKDVLDILKESGERLSLADLKAEGPDKKSLLQALIDKRDTELLLSPQLWVGHMQEFHEVWKALPSYLKKDEDLPLIQAKINMLSVRARFGAPGSGPAP